MANSAFLGLGSNLGERQLYLRAVVDALNAEKNCRVLKISSVYETSPYGNIEQNNYLNCVCKIETGFTLKELFDFTKNLELSLGRKPEKVKWGPREIDIDILFYNNLIYKDERMTVPHAEILKRDFVLVPLAEIEPELIHPQIDAEIGAIDATALENHIIGKTKFIQ